MGRGRHVRRRGPLARLRRRGTQPAWRDVHAQALVLATDDLQRLEAEVARLRSLEQLTTAAAVAAELRAERLERELRETRAALAAVAADVAALREELVWVFAEGKQAVGWPGAGPRVIDLSAPAAATA